MNGALTSFFLGSAKAGTFPKDILIPAFLFDKVNLFLASDKSVQKVINLPRFNLYTN